MKSSLEQAFVEGLRRGYTGPLQEKLKRSRRGHERRLAGAVLSQQRVDLADEDIQIDPVVGDDTFHIPAASV